MLRASLLAAIVTGLVACGGASVDPREGECDDYCALVIEHCSGTGHTQYGDLDTCLATCASMPLGDPAVHTGHTIACRTFAAATAERDADLCTQAGPGGDGTCGGNCESFCAIADEICTGANQVFDSVAACMTACAAFDATVVYELEQQSGDTLACRIYHLTAASNDPDFHCPHIAPVSSLCVGAPPT